jgi:ABC-2 type transport system permease protein
VKVLAIAQKSLVRIWRDRTALFFTILLPFAIILIIGLAIGGFSSTTVPVGIVHAGSGPLTTDLVKRLDHHPLLLRDYTSEDKIRRDVRRGAIVAGVVVPNDYDTLVRFGRSANITFIADLAHGFPAALRASVQAAVSGQGAELEAAHFASARAHKPFDATLTQARRVEAIVPAIGVKTETIGAAYKHQVVTPSGFEYTAPANLVLFVFITSFAGSAALIESRRLGVARRMLGTPTSVGEIVGGETAGRFTIAALQGIYIVLLGVLIFRVSFGNPLAAALLIAVFSLVATAFAMLAGTLLRTPEQAGSIGPIAGIAMGMLSGCMWPRFIMPPFMQHLGQLFPQSWAMDAFIKLIAQHASVAQIAPQLGVLAAFALVLLPLAAWRYRRQIVA